MKKNLSLFLSLCLLFTLFFPMPAWGNRKNSLKEEIQKHNSFIHNSLVLKQKYSQMFFSPFAFYRATAHLYYQDIKDKNISVPARWSKNKKLITWIQGDFHFQNIGFCDHQQKIYFDLNDFDEACRGPFYLDLLRFLTSLYLIKDEVSFHLTSSKIEKLSHTFLKEYFKTLKKVKGNGREKKAQITTHNLSGFLKKIAKKLKNKKNKKKLLDKWTLIQQGRRQFNFSLAKLKKPSFQEKGNIKKAWSTYLKSIAPFYQNHQQYFSWKSLAIRMQSGLGSLGVSKYYLLIEGKSIQLDDDILLEIKEQRKSEVERMLNSSNGNLLTGGNGLSRYQNQAKRAYQAHQAMLAYVDPYTGILNSQPKSYLVRRISPWKQGLEIKDFKKKKDLKNFLKYSAQILAYAHSRGDKDYDANIIPYSFEKEALHSFSSSSQKKLIFLAKKYAKQVQKDHHFFQKLLKSHQLP